jgi:cytosine/adenosine deaminase-related metal-dependent hydrolase
VIVIRNGTVVTVDAADTVLFGGHVVIDGDRLAAVGAGDYPAGPGDEVIDAGLLGPDCVAAHCVWLSDHEIALVRETGTHIARNHGADGDGQRRKGARP